MGKNLLFIRSFVYFINRTGEVREYISDVTSIIAFEIRGEKPFYFHLVDGMVGLHIQRAENPDVILTADGDTFYQVLVGKISQEEAFDQKLIMLQGAIVEAIRFRYIVNLTLEKNKILNCVRTILRSF